MNVLRFSETLKPELVAAASAAASTLPNSHQAESELLQQLRKHEAIPDTQRRAEGQNIGYSLFTRSLCYLEA